MRILLSTGPGYLGFSWFSKDHLYRACLECSRPGLKKEVQVNRLLVPEQCRRKGIGTALMEEFIGYIDHNHLSAELSINPYGEMTYEQLQKFYGKYGFVADEEIEGLFVRESR